MNNDEPVIHSRSSRRRKSSFSLAALLGVLTICAILLAWLVDHRRLVKQIGPPPQKLAVVYRLSNASAELATQKLNELFESDTVARDPRSNSLIVVAEQIDHERIQMILCYIDRKETEFVEAKTQTSKVESETLPTSTK